MAVANYHDQYGSLPPAYVADADGKPMHSWRILLLPYLECRSIYDQYDFSQPWNSPANIRLAKEMPPVYAFHGEYEPGRVTTNYLAVVGDTTAWPGASSTSYDQIDDGTSNTVLIVENIGANIHWMEPRDLQLETMSLQVNHPQGLSSKYLAPAVLMADGFVRSIEDDLAEEAFRALLTAAGGERSHDISRNSHLLPDGRLRQERARADTERNENENEP